MRTFRSALSGLLLASLVGAVTIIAATPASADYAEIDRYCGGTQNCRFMTDTGWGQVVHYRNGAFAASWNNSVRTSRASFHPSGYHIYSVTAPTIYSQTATCYCPTSTCAV